jgi:hypothetical protein
VLIALDRLGEPQDIVAAQAPPAVASRAAGIHEWSAIFLLLFGGFLLGFGWILGLILLWSSSAWRTLDKWIGTLVLPGGLLGAFLIFNLPVGSEECHTSGNLNSAAPVHFVCTGGPSTGTRIAGIVLLVVLLGAPILTAIHLGRRIRVTRTIAA